jgi:hypothetical protein
VAELIAQCRLVLDARSDNILMQGYINVLPELIVAATLPDAPQPATQRSDFRDLLERSLPILRGHVHGGEMVRRIEAALAAPLSETAPSGTAKVAEGWEAIKVSNYWQIHRGNVLNATRYATKQGADTAAVEMNQGDRLLKENAATPSRDGNERP